MRPQSCLFLVLRAYLDQRSGTDQSLGNTICQLRGDGRVGRQEAERLSPSRKVVSSMTDKVSKSKPFRPSPADHLRLIISLSRSGVECAEGLIAELEGIEDMAECVLREISD
jgi:hypothetical protein